MTETYTYDAFGTLTEIQSLNENGVLAEAETAISRFLYAGEQYDDITGLYYLRARRYDTTAGRFTQEDTYLGDGRNLYVYVGNNPLKYVDPSGHDKSSNSFGSALLQAQISSFGTADSYSGYLGQSWGNYISPTVQEDPLGSARDFAIGVIETASPVPTGLDKYVEHYELYMTGTMLTIPFGGAIDDALKYAGKATANGAKKLGGGIAKLVKATSFGSKMADKANDIGKTVKTAASTIKTTTVNVATEAASKIVNKVSEAGSKVTQKLSSAVEKVKGLFGSLFKSSADEVVETADTAKEILSTTQAEEYAFAAINGSNNAEYVLLGKYVEGSPDSYEVVASEISAQYFNLNNWDELSLQYSKDEIWKINEKFLDIQTSSGRDILLFNNPADYVGDGSFYSKEIQYLIENGYDFLQEGEFWHAIR